MTTRNDATRLTVRAKDDRRPRSLLGRQGQVLLDADLDQQSGHLLDRIETATDDMLGSHGCLVVPPGSAAFAVTPAATPDACGLGRGHGYLGGWLVENTTANCLLSTQPHPRTDTTPAATADAPVVLVLKSLIRYVDPVEEVKYADPALGDAQAAGRALIDWQVFPLALDGGLGGRPGCAASMTQPAWLTLVRPSSGTLTVLPDTAAPDTDPCSLAPQGGYSRPENLLYRIEVHDGIPRTDHQAADGPQFGLDGLTLKLSRRNASVLAGIVQVDGTRITVEPPALDPLNWFAPGAYAEFVSEHDDVDPRDAARRERLFQVNRATNDVVTLEAAAAGMADLVKDRPAGWFLRLWDAYPNGTGVATVRPSADDPGRSQLLDLGDGLRMRLGGGSDGVFRRGDFWTFYARADGSIDWPKDQAEPPHGPEIRYAPLATLTGPTSAQDCRVPAAALTDRALLYRGGDGQDLFAPSGTDYVTAPGLLRVAVMRGRTPVQGATVTWSMPPGGVPSRVAGTTVDEASTFTTQTDAEGLCEVAWSLNSHIGKPHQVRATLASATGTPEGPPLEFTARFRTALATSYRPRGCNLFQDTSTVQDALDVLCANISGDVEAPTLLLDSIRLLDPEERPRDLVRHDVDSGVRRTSLILNGLEVPYDAFVGGISLGTTLRGEPVQLASTPRPTDPVVEVELDLPYPGTDPDKVYWARASGFDGESGGLTAPFGFHRVRLDGQVTTAEGPVGTLEWRPSAMTRTFFSTAPQHQWGTRIVDTESVGSSGWKGGRLPRVLCRLRVRSAHVWAIDPETEGPVYLNAEHLGTSARDTRRELLVSERDPQRAADLDLFFYLRLGQQ
ncbi:DUF6519 domain-containing protein [Kitasatospora sp. MBT63]|uniref:DUF6519 domain-containing protein n=1 Tax=Kitasatospora sp. MBT63 TaxID=1444768 RepID=UPI0006907476|nr:DUF6519 domain-containing protein [Kitasatospora sp. MBT63]